MRSRGEEDNLVAENGQVVDSTRVVDAPAGAVDVDGWDDALSTGPMRPNYGSVGEIVEPPTMAPWPAQWGDCESEELAARQWRARMEHSDKFNRLGVLYHERLRALNEEHMNHMRILDEDLADLTRSRQEAERQRRLEEVARVAAEEAEEEEELRRAAENVRAVAEAEAVCVRRRFTRRSCVRS